MHVQLSPSELNTTKLATEKKFANIKNNHENWQVCYLEL